MPLNELIPVDESLLSELASNEAVVWSPQADKAAVQALSDLLVAASDRSKQSK